MAVATGIPVVSSYAAARAPEAEPRPMNVIMILVDDLGWADVSLHGRSDFFETPNLERLARQGISFTRAYAASPLCAPTRASIMTGQNPARLGITQARTHIPAANQDLQPRLSPQPDAGKRTLVYESAGALDSALPTLAKQVKTGGYATAHFGKWHLGYAPYSQSDHGFDFHLPEGCNGPAPAGNFVAPWRWPNFHPNHPNEHIEDRMAEEAVSWMEEQVAASQPFYMHYWQYSVHSPFDAKPEYIEYFRQKLGPGNHSLSPTYAAMVRSMDDAIGTLMDAVERLGIADHTAIIFLSDNGGDMLSGIRETDAQGKPFLVAPSQNAPLRGGKATLWEGGIRVPAIFVWPGVTPANAISDALIQTTDLYPTFHSLLGIDLPPDFPLDGVDITSALRGQNWERPGGLFTYFPHDFPVPDWMTPAMTMHQGDWKLICRFQYGDTPGTHAYHLYNLAEDIGEQNDLAAVYPERVEEMAKVMNQFIEEAGVLIPRRNPRFDPAQQRPEMMGVVEARPGMNIENGLRVAQTREERLARFEREDAARAAATRRLDRPPHGEPELGGWRAGRDTVGLRMEEGVLHVDSTGPDPWIELDLDEPVRSGAPFTLRVEMLPQHAVPTRLFGRSWEGRGFRPQDTVNVPVPAAGRWVDLSGELIGGTLLYGLRINMPGNIGETQVRNIRLEDASGQIIRRWF